MSSFIELTGVPQPLRADIFSPSNADAATIVIDAGAPTKTPLSYTVRLSQVGRSLQWNNCRLVHSPRWAGSFVRFVLEDERWRLRETIMRKSFNEYGLGGVVSNTRTIAELWQDIALASGITITTQTLPDFFPPAQWQGKKASECANELLSITACRMVYDPIEQTFVVTAAGDGEPPSLNARWKRPAVTAKPQKVVVRTSPTLYESGINIESRLPNDDGELVSFADAGAAAIDFFSGFESEAIERRAAWRNAAFRVWEITGASHPRALTPANMSIQSCRSIAGLLPEIRGERMTYSPRSFQVSSGEGIAMSKVEVPPGSVYAYSSDPVLRVDASGVIQTTAKLVACYYAFQLGVPDRETKEVDVPDGDGPEETIEVEWLNPVDSTIADAPDSSTNWEDIAQTIAEAHAAKWAASAEHVTIGGLHGTNGSGHVGAVRYRVALAPVRAFETTFALNFTPRWQL